MSRINTNTAAGNAYKNLSFTNVALERSIQKLSSGFRINRSADDAAGLAIANKLRSDVRSLMQAQRNASQANSMLQVADGAINTVATILDRMKELASQANSANVGAQTDKLDAEFQQLISEIDRIAQTTTYNGTALTNGGFGATLDTVNSTAYALADVAGIKLNGTAADTYTFSIVAGTSVTLTDSNGVAQTLAASTTSRDVLNFSAFGIQVEGGAVFDTDNLDTTTIVVTAASSGSFMVSSSGNYAGSDLVSVSGIDLRSTSLGVNGEVLSDATTAQSALAAIDSAIDLVSDAIGTVGAAQSRIDFASTNVANLVQNTSAAESVIRDADMAYEMTQFTKNQILQQAGTAMLAQANSAPQSILQLLRG